MNTSADGDSMTLDIKEKYDYVGHVMYPWNEKTRNVFYQSREVPTYTVMKNDQLFAKGVQINDTAFRILLKMGYSINIETRTHENGKRFYHGLHIRVKKIGKIGDPTQIQVLVKARDIHELTINTAKLVKLVYNETGIKGDDKLYGKLEMC